ncbi:unnamed protein product [Schistosoma margrebowiei]|uniref:Leishmanolysin-like peptidase n=1 Tax=Schistosoma margrebowiei TaxID=48269 RepID=A0A3P8DT60_9TREM|nr:unnamed protein product [Schistosoma margrebowiei]
MGSMVTSSSENILHCRRDSCKQKETCYNTVIPTKYLSACFDQKNAKTEKVFSEGEGIAPNEFVLLVSWNNVSCGADVLGWASYCSRDPDTSRPNLGIVNYCFTEGHMLVVNEKELVGITKHHICHSLGFIPSIYGNLPDLSPQYRMPGGK